MTSKAFDLINQQKLLVKLKGYGVAHIFVRWMASFLYNGSQRVNFK